MEANVEFPPYQDPSHDDIYFPFHKRYSDIKIEDIPPSVVKAYSDEKLGVAIVQSQNRNKNEQTESLKGDIISKLNGLTEESSEDDVLLLIQECHSLNLKLDLNRLARYAICRNALTVVKFLIEKGEADLTSRDIYARPAIFYVLWNYPNTEMIEYITSKISPRSEILNRPDRRLASTPLNLAVDLGRLDAIEVLIRLEANIDTINLEEDRWYIWSLIGFKDLIEMIPDLKIVHAEIRSQSFSYTRLTLSQNLSYTILTDENNLILIGIPWVNGILFFSALRQYGRQLGYPIYATDWLPSFFRQPVKVPANLDHPYTDPLYESNFSLDPESRRNAQSFTIFPCLMLRDRGIHKKVRRRIEDMRLRMPTEFTRMLLQSERTLDEAYFPSLSTSALDARNESQVVSRECTETLGGQLTNDDTKPILVVAQLWFWRCDRFILIAFSELMFEDKSLTLPVQTDDWNICPGIQTGLMIATHISKFGNPQMYGKFLSPLDIFEASAAHVLEDVDKYMDPSISSQPDIKKEQDFMFRISDIREELAMIQEVLGQQLEILQNYIDDFEQNDPDWQRILDSQLNGESEDLKELRKAAIKKWGKVKHSRSTIEKYQKRAWKIDADAERVEKRIQDQLNLKRTYASIDDARASIRLGIAGLVLSTAVIGFTVVTIIFAPLAFVTALFALPIDSLIRNQIQFNGTGSNSGTDNGSQSMGVYTTRYIGTWFAVAEIVSSGLTILFVAICLWLVRGTESFAALRALNSRPKTKRHWYDFRNKLGKNTTKVSVAGVVGPKLEENIAEPNAEATRVTVAESEPSPGHNGFRRRVANIMGRRKEGQSSEV
ncbi:hypothetical protein F5Y09DRAFT_226174 [Xylaria sp. FL1042]|nr:hypothetical protein F5Y09DRAFT_226174 [Xylaria sp. FL1042]